MLQDGGRNTFTDIDRIAHTMVGAARNPASGLTGLNTTFTANDPQLSVTIDRQKAEAMGVPMSQITAALGTFMGSSYVNDFNFNNRSYRVYVQADAMFRRQCERPAAVLGSLKRGWNGSAGQSGCAVGDLWTAGH